MLQTKLSPNLFSAILLFLFPGFVSAQADPAAAKRVEA
jgi:hypothetical protein